MKKKVVSLFLSIVMLLTLFSMSAFAEGSTVTVRLDANGGSIDKTAMEALTTDDIRGLVNITVDSAGLIRVTVRQQRLL